MNLRQAALILLPFLTACAAEPPREAAAPTPIFAAQTPIFAPQTPIFAPQTPIFALQTPILTASTPILTAPRPILTEPAPTAPITVPASIRAFREPLVPRADTHAVVLLYHLFGATMTSAQSVSPEAFEEQLAWLAEHHVEIITASELASFLDGAIALPARVAVITLDDGHISTFERAYPILKKHGVRFTMALNTEAIEGHRPEAVTWDNVNEMRASGLCELASHSHIHGHMERLTEASNRREVTLSRAIIEQRTGVRAETFVFPFGGHDQRVMGLVEEAGYRAAFAVGTGRVRLDSPRWALPRKGVLRSTTLSEIAVLFRS
jgi:peptidoglycan/xylan/chitin deacetylase (PgdA/CDA1 family)